MRSSLLFYRKPQTANRKPQTALLQESRTRSLLKGLSWRIIATTSIIIIAYLTTGEIDMALKIGGIEFFIKLGLYYGHERLWQRIPRGTIRQWWKRK